MGQLLKRIAVGIDFTKMDETVIKFAEFVAQRNKSSEIYFVHVIKNARFPEEISLEYPDIDQKIVDEKEKELIEHVNKYWNRELDTKVIYRIKKGKVAKNLLKVIDANEIDIVIIGKSLQSEERGLLAQKLARLASCQLLIVPESCTPRFVKTLVPINHSDNDRVALKRAIDIVALSGPEAEIVCQNIYSVPVGYHYTGKNYDEFARVMEDHTRKKYEKLIKSLDTRGVKIRPVYTLDKNEGPIDVVYQLALEENPDSIVLAAKGQSTTTALFLSSVAEKLIQIDTKFPIRIVRKRGENAGLMDFIRKI